MTGLWVPIKKLDRAILYFAPESSIGLFLFFTVLKVCVIFFSCQTYTKSPGFELIFSVASSTS